MTKQTVFLNFDRCLGIELSFSNPTSSIYDTCEVYIPDKYIVKEINESDSPLIYFDGVPYCLRSVLEFTVGRFILTAITPFLKKKFY